MSNLLNQLDIPVVVIFYNRPHLLNQLHELLKAIQPSKLYLVADGPRSMDDLALCNSARKIFDDISWSCEVFRNYALNNMGCKNRVTSGLDWVFENEESAIILEDDCLPDQSFFEFAAVLLKKYRDDTRIAAISGNNFVTIDCEYSYMFSRYTHLWGWATWRRVWHLYDREMKSWDELCEPKYAKQIFFSNKEFNAFSQSVSSIKSGALDTWDSQWTLACLSNNMLTIMPNNNLVSNIGFGENATHTKGLPEEVFLKSYPMVFPLRHPAIIRSDSILDQTISDRYLTPRGILEKLIIKIKKLCIN